MFDARSGYGSYTAVNIITNNVVKIAVTRNKTWQVQEQFTVIKCCRHACGPVDDGSRMIEQATKFIKLTEI